MDKGAATAEGGTPAPRGVVFDCNCLDFYIYVPMETGMNTLQDSIEITIYNCLHLRQCYL